MEADPEFHPYQDVTPTANEQKKRVARQLARLNHLNLLPSNINQLNYKAKVFFFFFFYKHIKTTKNKKDSII